MADYRAGIDEARENLKNSETLNTDANLTVRWARVFDAAHTKHCGYDNYKDSTAIGIKKLVEAAGEEFGLDTDTLAAQLVEISNTIDISYGNSGFKNLVAAVDPDSIERMVEILHEHLPDGHGSLTHIQAGLYLYTKENPPELTGAGLKSEDVIDMLGPIDDGDSLFGLIDGEPTEGAYVLARAELSEGLYKGARADDRPIIEIPGSSTQDKPLENDGGVQPTGLDTPGAP